MKIIRNIFLSIIFFVGSDAIAEEAHLFTWVDQDDVPFIQYYIDKYGAEPKTSVFEDEDEDIKLPQIANETEKLSREAGIGIDFLAEETKYLIDSIEAYVKALKKAGF